ncbi:hypothetical protein B1400_1400 [Bifidobacterium italicum]|uniref:Uncharacterized protein n=1 Tax=Bifidobacterium italicum TaxID=1960968 RepID=A0A2A2EHX1_9BIFI|nr:hypothetical protein B1400_1400 [Bifidobacterium italicum]
MWHRATFACHGQKDYTETGEPYRRRSYGSAYATLYKAIMAPLALAAAAPPCDQS